MPADHISEEQLVAYLERCYAVQVKEVQKLDFSVLRIQLVLEQKQEDAWVARLFRHQDAYDASCRLVTLLEYLQEQSFPAEEPILSKLVTEVESSGICVLLTRFAGGQ
jgi:hypothetical protein